VIIHQFLPTFERGAVGGHALLARQTLRDAGHESEIFAAETRESVSDEGARDLAEYRGGADVRIYQMAIGSVAADQVLTRHEPLVVNHHNLTPLRYLAGWEPVAAHGVAWGRQQLRELATRADLGLAVSHFNEADLLESGFTRTTVVPFLVELDALAVEPDASIARTGDTQWLFVGRIAPNKTQHDLVKSFAAYRRFHDPAARLTLVGGGIDSAYGATLSRFVHALGLDDAVSMPGVVSAAQLAAYYRTADVLVVVSEHEGFCVPLIEAMYYEVPIVAYAAAAVPETLGSEAGLLLHDKDPCTVAAAVARVVSDAPLRAQLVAAGTERARQFDISRTGPAFVDAVTGVAR
jgi:glycosyltransferase involved in cell wall biosynthesis